MQTKLYAFKATDGETTLERAISLPGWSHRSQPKKQPVLYYPFEERYCTYYFYAAGLRQARKAMVAAKLFCSSDPVAA